MISPAFRTAQRGDVPLLMRLVEGSPGAPHWSMATWQQVLASSEEPEHRVVMIAEHEAAAIGFGVLGIIAGEAEIESLGVSAAYRRQRVGGQICAELFAWASERGATQVFLDVRLSNRPARALYRSLGFQERGIRRRYYREPDEDAITMSKEL